MGQCFDFEDGTIFRGPLAVGQYIRILGIYWLTDWRTNTSAVAFGLGSARAWMDHRARFGREELDP